MKTKTILKTIILGTIASAVLTGCATKEEIAYKQLIDARQKNAVRVMSIFECKKTCVQAYSKKQILEHLEIDDSYAMNLLKESEDECSKILNTKGTLVETDFPCFDELKEVEKRVKEVAEAKDENLLNSIKNQAEIEISK